MKTIRVMFFLISITGICLYAETVYYTLDHVILDNGSQMTGIFSWVYTPGDFANGVGEFVALDIPGTAHDQDDLVVTIDATESIEFSFDGNLHDDGVDIMLVLSEPLTPTTSSTLNLSANESKYSIGGNGFNDGVFLSGSIAPIDIILSIESASSGVVSVSWTPEVPGLVLQETTSLLATHWVNSASSTTNPAVLSVAAPTMFYQLVMP